MVTAREKNRIAGSVKKSRQRVREKQKEDKGKGVLTSRMSTVYFVAVLLVPHAWVVICRLSQSKKFQAIVILMLQYCQNAPVFFQSRQL